MERAGDKLRLSLPRENWAFFPTESAISFGQTVPASPRSLRCGTNLGKIIMKDDKKPNPPPDHETSLSVGEWLTFKTSFRGLVALVALAVVVVLAIYGYFWFTKP